ncbi:glutamate racemase [Leptolyngbya iicbica]|uniref:Glutamate racemase n=2 Tax=Cyanophyceae TaxID=3028117 RepID=A0A4Q7EA29_9CYAN|nr:glutamate racemase [Leptolyngbya sp. LK]RZM79309.1 glutamate racemase [Leptolyngbya sp. LK]
MAYQRDFASAPVSTAPIGIFDSGVGGLTVLREINRQLPYESILYVGDTARLPYGDRTPDEILQFVREIMTWMMAQGTKMVMMACNTSSALVLEQVQAEFPVPILGLIHPGARAAAKAGDRIGVIATAATVASNAYRNAILEVDSAKQVWQMGCPKFVPLIEQDRLQDPATIEVAKAYLQPLLAANIDTLIYGCTHYPHLAPVFKAFLPETIQRIDPAQSMVKAAAKELELLDLKSTVPGRPTQFFVSGCPDQFAHLAARLIGQSPRVEQVNFELTVQSAHQRWFV